MSAFVLNPNFGLLDGLSVPVVDTLSKSSVKATFDLIAALKQVRSASSWVFDDLQLLALESEVSIANNKAFMLAQRFLLALPSQLPPPELAFDDDGEIAFDWRNSRGFLLSLTLREDGRLSYAARFSAFDKEYGTKRFDSSIPRQVIELVQRVAQG